MQPQNFKIALLQSSTKPFEKRVPVHPEHFDVIEHKFRKFLYFERNYSINLGYPNSYHESLGYNTEERSNLIASADCSILVRPMPQDILSMRKDSLAIGWFHCIQFKEMAEAAVSKQITLIGMENLYHQQKYFFEENSKISGKEAIIHALEAAKIKIEKNPTCIVIGQGNAGRAAIETLQALGINDIICCSKRDKKDIKDKVTGVVYMQIIRENDNTNVLFENNRPIVELLKQASIIINATAQDIYEPSIFLYKKDLKHLKKGTLIIDISCDKCMGFDFSTITSLTNPIIPIENILYYAVDHLPTLDYNNASKAISSKIITLIPDIINYLTSSELSSTLEKAIQIKQGLIINPDIKYFQKHFLHSNS